MKKFWFVISVILMVGSLSLFTSCTESEGDEMLDISSSSDFALLAETVYSEEGEESDSTEMECFTVTFPITLINPDNTTTDITTEGDLEDYYDEWEDAYEDNGTIPTLVYPIEVTLADGTVSSIDNDQALRELLMTCSDGEDEDEEGDYEDEDEEDDDEDDDDDMDEDEDDEAEDAEELAMFLTCYEFVFPLSLTNEVDTISVNSIEEFVAAYEAEQEGEDYDIVFPIELIDLKDNSTISVATEDELEDLEDLCGDS